MSLDRTVVLSAGAPTQGGSIAELWDYRGLIYFLISRDLKVRYAHTALGVLWALAQPAALAAAFTVVFARIGHIASDGVPYPIFVLAALVPWTYVSGAVAAAAASLLNNAHVITKVYFPRLVIPVAAAGTGLVDFAVALLMLILAAVLWAGMAPCVEWLLLPLPIALFVVIAAGAGAWLAALSVQYRDVKHLTPLLTMLWLYASPVAYPLSRVPARGRLLYAINPLAGTLAAFRAFLVDRAPDWGALAVSTAAAVALYATGVAYFRRIQGTIADSV